MDHLHNQSYRPQYDFYTSTQTTNNGHTNNPGLNISKTIEEEIKQLHAIVDDFIDSLVAIKKLSGSPAPIHELPQAILDTVDDLENANQHQPPSPFDIPIGDLDINKDEFDIYLQSAPSSTELPRNQCESSQNPFTHHPPVQQSNIIPASVSMTHDPHHPMIGAWQNYVHSPHILPHKPWKTPSMNAASHTLSYGQDNPCTTTGPQLQVGHDKIAHLPSHQELPGNQTTTRHLEGKHRNTTKHVKPKANIQTQQTQFPSTQQAYIQLFRLQGIDLQDDKQVLSVIKHDPFLSEIVSRWPLLQSILVEWNTISKSATFLDDSILHPAPNNLRLLLIPAMPYIYSSRFNDPALPPILSAIILRLSTANGLQYNGFLLRYEILILSRILELASLHPAIDIAKQRDSNAGSTHFSSEVCEQCRKTLSLPNIPIPFLKNQGKIFRTLTSAVGASALRHLSSSLQKLQLDAYFLPIKKTFLSKDDALILYILMTEIAPGHKRNISQQAPEYDLVRIKAWHNLDHVHIGSKCVAWAIHLIDRLFYDADIPKNSTTMIENISPSPHFPSYTNLLLLFNPSILYALRNNMTECLNSHLDGVMAHSRLAYVSSHNFPQLHMLLKKISDLPFLDICDKNSEEWSLITSVKNSIEIAIEFAQPFVLLSYSKLNVVRTLLDNILAEIHNAGMPHVLPMATTPKPSSSCKESTPEQFHAIVSIGQEELSFVSQELRCIIDCATKKAGNITPTATVNAGIFVILQQMKHAAESSIPSIRRIADNMPDMGRLQQTTTLSLSEIQDFANMAALMLSIIKTIT